MQNLKLMFKLCGNVSSGGGGSGGGGGSANKAVSSNARRSVTFVNQFTGKKETREVVNEKERLTKSALQSTAEKLNPATISSLNEIEINGIKYRRERDFESTEAGSKSSVMTRNYTFQSTIGHEVERASGISVEYPIVTIAVDIKTTNSKKKGKVQSYSLNTRKTKIGLV